MKRRPTAGRLVVGATIAAAAIALVTLAVAPRSGALEEDERDYLRAASHLARHGVLSHTPLAAETPAADAYREPGYSFAIAAAWKLARCAPPAGEGELADSIRSGTCTATAVRGLHLLLLAAAMFGAGLAARRLGAGTVAALVAAAIAGASPALRQQALGLFSENLAAPLVTLFSAIAAAALATRRRSAWIGAALLAGLAPLARSALLVLPVAGAFLAALPAAAGEPRKARLRRSLLFLSLALLPALLWAGRNFARTGHAVLADRTGAVLLVRAELDRQVAREGATAAALHWTPLDAAQRYAAQLSPGASFDRYSWSGEGNFFTRAIRRWRETRAAAGDPLAADRRLAREAVGAFLRHPLDHLRTTLAVAWRGLFAERSPRWTAPVDLAFAAGLLLAALWIDALVRSFRRRDRAALALLLPATLLFAAHALATENLPRFAAPALPLAWAAAAATIAARAGRTAGPAQKSVKSGAASGAA